MRIRNIGKYPVEAGLMMTPMIDIVFQLIIFFILTFKIASPEGDFNIRMPLAAPSSGGKPDQLQLPALKIRLTAAPNGRLSGIFLGQTAVKDFQTLRGQIVGILGDDTGPGSAADAQEVELDCDYNLDFRYTIDAVTAVSGQITAEGEIVKLIQKIKFAPPRKP
jgi:biopolymer transport protein ExbD